MITEVDFASVEVEDRIETLDSQSDPPIKTPTNMAQRGIMLVVGHICRLTLGLWHRVVRFTTLPYTSISWLSQPQSWDPQFA